jgi:hypothetical protein
MALTLTEKRTEPTGITVGEDLAGGTAIGVTLDQSSTENGRHLVTGSL